MFNKNIYAIYYANIRFSIFDKFNLAPFCSYLRIRDNHHGDVVMYDKTLSVKFLIFNT